MKHPFCLKRCCAAGAAMLFGASVAGAVVFDFDGSLQGWSDLTAPNTNTGPRHWGGSPPAFGGVHGGTGAVGQHIVGGTQDSPHPTLWLRSPEFKLDGSGNLTCWLKGGTGSTAPLPANQSAVPANSTSPGPQFVALRNAGTAAFVLTGRKTSSGDAWQQVTFTAAQLAALDQNATYTLDLIDAGHGDWGWVTMDTVSIPGTFTPPTFSISGGDRAVTTLYTNISGTALTHTLLSPLWYEVRSNDASGALLDFGAFVPQPDWQITVRHLRFGPNVLLVSGRNGFGLTATNAITLTLPHGPDTPVRPRPVPAELWWGGLSVNQQLLDPARPWDFVKQYQDGYFFHSAGYGGLTDEDKRDLAVMLRPYNTKYCVELGGATSPDPNWAAGHWNGWGTHLLHQDSLGLVMSDFTHDTHVELMEDFCRANPSWPAQDLVVHYTGDLGKKTDGYPLASGQWRDVFQRYHAHRPHSKVAVTSCPIYWTWDAFPHLPGAWNNLHYDPLRSTNYVPNNSGEPPVLVNGETVSFSFNGRDIYESFVNMAVEIGRPHFDLFSDAPWDFYVNWGAGSPVLRAKVRAYESYLQSRGARHTLVCNVSNAANQPGGDDAQDLYYKEKSFDMLVRHQLEGGRANRYLFESWYYGIPHTCAPETKEGSFANLALAGIKFLKGIRDTSGALEPLTLTLLSTGATSVVRLRNDGEVACLPALVGFESGSVNMGTRYYNPDGVEITSQVLSAGGWVPSTLLQPGQALTISCVASYPGHTPPSDTKTMTLEAFWNPQDPTGVVRDRLTWSVTATPAPAPLTYNFDDGTLQGWTVVSTDASNRQSFAIVPPSVNSPNITPQSGATFIGLHIPAFGGSPLYTQDGAHDTLWLRSPEFTLNGAGELTAWLSGGTGYGADATGKRAADVPAQSFDDPNHPVFPSFLGIALRNVNTGVFDLAGRKVNNGNAWEPVTFTAAQLATLDPGATYTLDLLDVRHGGWGWVNLDSVSIPGALAPALPPTLTIQSSSDGRLRLSWPSGATGFTLQRSAVVNTGYTNAGLTVTIEGNEFVAYDTPAASALFYRLRK